MKRILSFGASNSIESINKKLAFYSCSQLTDCEIDFVDLNDFEMPIFSIDREKENGVHELAIKFKEHIKVADGILISFAEHNGSFSAAFKNILDWVSRVEKSMWNGKPMLVMATSPGGRGGRNVLDFVKSRFQYMDGPVVAEFSLPFFNKNFSLEDGILDADLNKNLKDVLSIFMSSLEKV